MTRTLHGYGWFARAALAAFLALGLGVPLPAVAGDAGISTGVARLSRLRDVTLTTPATGSVLTYDGTDWIDGATLPQGGEYIPAADLFIPLSASGTNWVTEVACGVAADSNQDGETVTLCDPTAVEGFGIEFMTPTAFTSLVVTVVGRAETTPGGAVGAVLSITCREGVDNALTDSWGTARALLTFSFTADEKWQIETGTVTAANLGISASSLVQCEIARQPAVAADTLASDLVVRGLRVGFQ